MIVGLLLVGIPLYDIWTDVTEFGWAFALTLAENAVFLLLSGSVLLGGFWLLRNDWETHRVWVVARWTCGGCIAVALLMGWVIHAQRLAMHALKPYVIAMDGVLIGATVIFYLGLLSARMDAQHSQLQWEREANESLETLHQFAIDLQEAETARDVYERGMDCIESILDPDKVHIVIEGAAGTQRTKDQHSFTEGGTSTTVPISDRGYVELLDEDVETHEKAFLEILSTHLARTLERIDREQDLDEELERFALVNRMLRHNLRNDLNVVRVHLEHVEDQLDSTSEHLETVTTYIEKMVEFVEQMQQYIQLVEKESHELGPVNLRATLEDVATSLQQAHSHARVSLSDIPEGAVRADELLGPLFENLVQNAIAHNDKDIPEVEITGERDDDKVIVEIADNGPGIPDEYKEIIREPGKQIGDNPGSGIGLHLVTEAIQAYSGKLEIRNNEPEGTVFRVVLPDFSVSSPEFESDP